MKPARVATGICLLLAAGCSRAPDIYAPPIERRPLEGVVPELGEFVEMSSPAASRHLVRDILNPSPGQAYRWTNARPALRFQLWRKENRRLRFDFVIAETTLKETGPVTIIFRVNDRLLGTARYDTHGEKRFEKPVPADWLGTTEPVIVSAEIDRVWVSKLDGMRLGILLHRAGFVP